MDKEFVYEKLKEATQKHLDSGGKLIHHFGWGEYKCPISCLTKDFDTENNSYFRVVKPILGITEEEFWEIITGFDFNDLGGISSDGLDIGQRLRKEFKAHIIQ